jgi:hypothetical protein
MPFVLRLTAYATSNKLPTRIMVAPTRVRVHPGKAYGDAAESRRASMARKRGNFVLPLLAMLVVPPVTVQSQLTSCYCDGEESSTGCEPDLNADGCEVRPTGWVVNVAKYPDNMGMQSAVTLTTPDTVDRPLDAALATGGIVAAFQWTCEDQGAYEAGGCSEEVGAHGSANKAPGGTNQGAQIRLWGPRGEFSVGFGESGEGAPGPLELAALALPGLPIGSVRPQGSATVVFGIGKGALFECSFRVRKFVCRTYR